MQPGRAGFERRNAPFGVAWPTVSATHTRDAPARIAVVNSARSESGSARVVSSVTYMTERPCFTANDTASSVHFFRKSRPQPSAYWRIGLEPMKAQHSIGTPVRSTISAIGLISATIVRAAQLA